MSCSILCLQRFLWSLGLQVLYSCLVLFQFCLVILKNPFRNPWAQKLRLEPPPCFNDPKYGVHKYMIFNNTKLHYVESGDPSKPLMIFIHGFPEFWYSWRHQIVEFSKDYWCIAVDMKGYGDSEKPEDLSAYKLPVLVNDVRDIVRKLGREKCILVAHDWGSVIASKYRDIYPETLLGIILLGGTTVECWHNEMWASSEQFKMSWYVFLFQVPWIPEKMMQMNDFKVLDQSMLVKGKESVTKYDVECYKYWFGKPFALTPPINYYRSNFGYIVPAKPRCDLPIPFLVINGDGDLYLSKNLMKRIKEYYTNIETVILDNCGHFIQQEEPQRVNKLIRDFLKKNNV